MLAKRRRREGVESVTDADEDIEWNDDSRCVIIAHEKAAYRGGLVTVG